MASSELSTQSVTRLSTILHKSGTPDQGSLPATHRSDGSGDHKAGQQERALTVDSKGLANNVEHLNNLVQKLQRKLEFSIDDTTGRTVIKVIDAQTGGVIRQIPGEEALALIEHLQGENGSLMVEEEA